MKYNQSNFMKLAHQLTKSIIQPGDNYRATLGMVISFLHQDITITLQDICNEVGISDKKARRILRKVYTGEHQKAQRWQWQGYVPAAILNRLTA